MQDYEEGRQFIVNWNERIQSCCSYIARVAIESYASEKRKAERPRDIGNSNWLAALDSQLDYRNERANYCYS
jgi:hypothetical protein